MEAMFYLHVIRPSTCPNKMAMLAEPRRRQKLSFDPRNKAWTEGITLLRHWAIISSVIRMFMMVW